MPYEEAYLMARALTEAKVPGRVELLLGSGHGWGGAELDHTRGRICEFFGRVLKK